MKNIKINDIVKKKYHIDHKKFHRRVFFCIECNFLGSLATKFHKK